MSKKVIFISLIFIIVIALGGVSLLVKNFYSGPKYRIVNISGIEVVCNLSKSSLMFIPYSKEGENLASPMANGDLLLLDDDFYFRYRDSDGLQLNFSYDQTGLIKNNDKIISLFIDEDSNVCEWIKNNESSAFKDLRSIRISGPLNESNLECLKKISEIKPDPGIYITYMDSVFIKKLISMFDPSWLVFGGIFIIIEEEVVLDELFSDLNNLELLLISGSYKLDFLYNIPGLNSLIIHGLDTEVNKNFTFGKIKNLKSLSIIESDMEDLSYIGEIPGLRSLNLNTCNSLKDISQVKNFSRLKSLNLAWCDEIPDISVINSISSLTWLSFPPATSQETFANIVDQHPSLQVIELIVCEDIIDLSPFESLDKIKAIALFGVSTTDYTPLYHLKTLEYILIDEEKFEENEKEISDLQEALPNAQIIPGACLGSGWLLLLFPIILILGLIRGYLYKSG